MVLAGTPFVPETKSPGDLIESAEWNAATEEIKRLEVDKLNRKGADTLQGPLTIEQALRVGNVSAATLATLPNGSRLTVANSSTDLLNVRFQQGGGALEFVNWTSGWNINTKTAGKHLCLNRDASETSNVYVGRANNDICVKGNGNVGLSVDPTARLDITGVGDTAGQISLQLRSGNSGSDYRSSQVTFGYNKLDKYRHVIKTRHNGGSKSGNAIDFYVWKYIDQTNKDAPETIGTLHTMTLDGGNVGIGTTSPQAKLQVIDTSTTAGSGTTFVLGPTTASSLRLGYHQDYSWIQSNGNKPLAINPTGNVGIGTTDPKAKLQVSGGKLQLDGDQQLVFTDSGTSNNLKLQLWSGYGLGINSSTLFYTAAGRHSWRDNSSVERMALTTTANGGLTVNGTGNSWFAGNLGVGTMTPSAKLHVDGNAVVSNGNLGIGIVPEVKLHIAGVPGDTNVGTDEIVRLLRPLAMNGQEVIKRSNSAGLFLGTFEGNQVNGRARLDFKLSGTPEPSNDHGRNPNVTVMSLQADGNVGIGTTSPTTKLHVVGTGGVNTEVLRVANSSTDFMNVQSSSTTGGGQLQFIAWSSGWNINTKTKDKHLYLNRDADSTANVYIGRANNDICVKGSNGNVGLAVDPTEKLHVNGNALISGNVKATSLTVSGNAIITTSAGNVGIGTNDPKAKLHVIGTGGSNVDLIVNGRLKSDSDDGGLWVKDDRFVGGHEKNQIGFYNGGAWRLSVLNNGNVGIGTTDPKARLDIATQARTNTHPTDRILYVTGAIEAEGKGVEFRKSDASEGIGFGCNTIYAAGNNNTQDLSLKAKGTGKVKVTSSLETNSLTVIGTGNAIVNNGKMGIGIASPDAKLHIINQSTDTSGKTLILGSTEVNQTYLSLGYNTNYGWIQSFNSKPLALNAAGNNVGIGTTNPSERLEVNGSLKILGSRIKSKDGYGIVATDQTDWLRINPDGSYPGTAFYKAVALGSGGGLVVGEWSQQGEGVLKVTKSSYLATTSGNVGIGTTDPQAKLHVNGAGGTTVEMIVNGRMRSSGTHPGLFMGDDKRFIGGEAAGKVGFYNEGWHFTVLNNGNVGIGANSPKTSLDISKNAANALGPILTLSNTGGGSSAGVAIDFNSYNIAAQGAYDPTARIRSFDNNWSSHLAFLTKAPGAAANQLQERLRIQNDGKVGIGTTNPSEKLEVNGSLKILGSRIKSKDGYGIVATDQTDWLRINPDGSYPGTAFYKAVALGSGGGLVVGEWSQQGEGVLKVTKSSYLATTSGNVGIGTTSPQAKLHVQGGTTILEQEPWRDLITVNKTILSEMDGCKVQYFKDSLGIVHFRGKILKASGQNSSEFLVHQLPESHRSDTGQYFIIPTSHGDGSIYVDATGNVKIWYPKVSGAVHAHIDGITFRAKGS